VNPDDVAAQLEAAKLIAVDVTSIGSGMLFFGYIVQ
jgi:hypothetical protein